MTLFTVEGLIGAQRRTERGLGFTVGVVHAAYDRWLDTQMLPPPANGADDDPGLVDQPWLYARRAPGQTCLTAIESARAGARRIRQYGNPAANDSKGCGAVMRSAPFGLLPASDYWTVERRFDVAVTAAAYTHGHPTGQLAAGTLAAVVAHLVAGLDLVTAVGMAAELLAKHHGHEETSAALALACSATAGLPPIAETVESLGGGWVAEEALAIGVYAALTHPGPHEMLDALALAVTHSGDSDSTGSICGNILGALHGEAALPPELLLDLEGRDPIIHLATTFTTEFPTP
jgi:ADP-ribosylglycohydrolase